MKKMFFRIILAVFLIIFDFIFLLICGRTINFKIPVAWGENTERNVTYDFGPDSDCVELLDIDYDDDNVYVKLRAVHKGVTYINIFTNYDKFNYYNRVIYVNGFKVVCIGYIIGKSSGDIIIPITVIFYLMLLIIERIIEYRKGLKENFYQYKNIKNLGIIIYLFSLVLGQLRYFTYEGGLYAEIDGMVTAGSAFSQIAFPIAIIASVVVTVSNYKLMKKEGKTWRNMLGCILGIAICLATIIPVVVSEMLYRTSYFSFIDVHNLNAPWAYIDMGLKNIILAGVTYLETMLLGTVFFGVKAARHIPAFDKDYILILGCQIKKDGSLTNLLKGRADRAIQFARMQKVSSGKEIVFVPSGGQGSDEVTSEAEAISSYLISQGIPEERILVEDKSENTYANLKNSVKLIEERNEKLGITDVEPKIAFSTTNYHVLRAGLIATQLGIPIEGIGSRTLSYFWVNAFIREFIATMYSEYKTHIKAFSIISVVIIIMLVMLYYANTV